MSGFEIAGVVLGTLPLLISALENYAQAIDTIKRARKYKIELKRIKHDLDAECAIFLDTLERLIDGLVTPKQFEELLNDPKCELWKSEALKKRLQERLGRSYLVYTDSVNEMNTLIERFAELLDLDEQGKTRWTDSTGLGLVSKRAGFSLRKRAFDDLVERLQKHNRYLEKLINRSIEFEPSRKKRAKSSGLQRLGQYAKCVFHALEASFGCTCRGTDTHTALLGISARSTTGWTEPEELVNIQVVISGKIMDAQGHQTQSSTWQELSLRAVREDCKDPSSDQANQMMLTPVNGSAAIPAVLARSKTRKVRFFQSSATIEPTIPLVGQRTTTQIITTNSASSSNTLLVQSSPPAQPISNLCEVVRTRPSALCADPGYVVDSNQKFSLQQVAHADSLDKNCWKTIPLWQILDGSAIFPPLTPWDRITLSATLASAVLQLNGSPWLDSIWNNDVIFLKRSDQRPYKEAFLAKKMLDTGKAAARPSQNFIYDDTLLALAVALIELSLGPFKKLQTQEDLNAGNIADLVTACRLVAEDKVLEQYGPRYQAAVKRCIELAKSCKTWNEDIQQEMYEGVVSVLEDQAMRQNSVP